MTTDPGLGPMKPEDPVAGTASPSEVQEIGRALVGLTDAGHGALAKTITRLLSTIAEEAARSPRFARALNRALVEEPAAVPKVATKRSNRRAPGPFDPFAVFADGGSGALRAKLQALGLEQLRDIIAEHGMDTDRLAMKWKDPERIIGRIIERVESRAMKGSAFRAP